MEKNSNKMLTYIRFFLPLMLILMLYSFIYILLYSSNSLDLIIYGKCIANPSYIEKDGILLNTTRLSSGLDFSYDEGKSTCSFEGIFLKEPEKYLKIYLAKDNKNKCFTCINKPVNHSSILSSFLGIIMLTIIIFVTLYIIFLLSVIEGYLSDPYKYSKNECV